MTFTVTYRAKDGALREETVEAADRAECMAVKSVVSKQVSNCFDSFTSSTIRAG